MRKLQDLKKQDENAAEREKQIVKTSIVGIITNVVLAAIKAIVGLASNSIAIILDAVNNIADAGSSLITIVGTKLAAKDPDKEHPFGYGRVEYLSAMIISVIDIFSRGNKKDYESSYTYICYTIFNYSSSSSCG